jgi:hypothetical protein
MRSAVNYVFRGIAIPIHTAEGIDRYVQERIHPGSFLEAVLCNDLREACAHADEDNAVALWAIVAFLYNEIPIAAWGSPEKFTAWLEMRL